MSDPGPHIKRVVVPLDATAESRTAIDTAARLAAQWHVPLSGVFVENEELIGLAALPFARQVTLGAGREALTPENVAAHLRAAAEQTRQELAAAAKRHGVEWSFAAVRGAEAERALAGTEGDFVVAGAASRPIGRYFRVASRWWSSLATTASPLLLARRSWESGGSVLTVLHRRDPAAARLLDISAELAHLGGGALSVIGSPDPGAPQGFGAWVAQVLEHRPHPARVEQAALDLPALRARIVELDCRLVVFDRPAEPSRTEQLRALRILLEGAACDVLTAS